MNPLPNRVPKWVLRRAYLGSPGPGPGLNPRGGRAFGASHRASQGSILVVEGLLRGWPGQQRYQQQACIWLYMLATNIATVHGGYY